jgi:hypothetical protein
MASPRVVIVSMFKNESWLLKEWIEHHLSAGVSHFYLVDNGSSDGSREVLEPFIERGVVSYAYDARRPVSVAEKTFRAEVPVYCTRTGRVTSKECATHIHTLLVNDHWLETVKNHSDWVAVLDCDEYLYSTRGTLPTLLGGVQSDVAALWVPWKMFGSSGLIDQPDSIRRSFVFRESLAEYKVRVGDKRTAGFGKSLTRTTALTRLGIHESNTTPGLLAMCDGRCVPKRREDMREWLATYVADPDTDLVHCNHYSVMSASYFEQIKMQRPGGTGTPRGGKAGTKYWSKNNKNTVDDRGIL